MKNKAIAIADEEAKILVELSEELCNIHLRLIALSHIMRDNHITRLKSKKKTT